MVQFHCHQVPNILANLKSIMFETFCEGMHRSTQKWLCLALGEQVWVCMQSRPSAPKRTMAHDINIPFLTFHVAPQ
jgi:hypothetical protein